MKIDRNRPNNVGDLVYHISQLRSLNNYGIILERVHDPRALHNKVFKILWRNGRIGENVWDYDLELVNESR